MDANDQKGTQELERFRSDPERALADLYSRYRTRFVRWGKSWTHLDDDNLADIFQESTIIFWENIQTGRLTELRVATETYLFSIGKRLILSKLRSSGKNELPGNDKLPEPEELELHIEQQIIQDEITLLLKQLLSKLGEPCLSLLRMFYYQSMRCAAIAQSLGYASEDVVRTQKKRCIEKLRSMALPTMLK